MRSASSPPTVGSTTISNSVVITSMPVSIARLAMPRSARGTMLPKLRLQRDPSPAGFAHHASATGNLTMPLATLNEVIAGGKVSWVLEADLKNFFGSLSHKWGLRFVEHRVGDPRMISLIRRWLKAGILEDGEVYPNEEGTPQGGSISVMLSNVYLHYVLDLWFERVVKPRLRGEAHMIRYIDDFVMCFQY